STLDVSLGTGGAVLDISDTNANTSTTINSGSGNTVNLTTDSSATTINAGSGQDIINVLNDGATTTINGGNDIINVQAIQVDTPITGTADTINVGSNAQGSAAAPNTNSGSTLSNIAALLAINEGGASTANVGDDADITSSTFTLTGATLSSSVSGFGSGGSITYSGLANLNVTLGSAANFFNIQSTTAGSPKVTGGSGTATFNVGQTVSSANNRAGITGKLTIDAAGGADNRLIVDNSGATADQTVTLGDATTKGYKAITGLAPAEVDYTTSGAFADPTANSNDGILLLLARTKASVGSTVSIQSTVSGRNTKMC